MRDQRGNVWAGRSAGGPKKLLGDCPKGGDHQITNWEKFNVKNLHCSKCGRLMLTKRGSPTKKTPQYLADL